MAMRKKTKHSLLESISQIAQQNDEIVILWLYGSRAKGNFNEHSDYDLAVAMKAFEPETDRAIDADCLAYEFRQQLGLDDETKISIVDINAIPIQLAHAIVSHGRVIKCVDGLRLAREENRITGLFEESYPKEAI